MTAGDREALAALGNRLRHVAATANLLARVDLGLEQADALTGIGTTLDELHERLDDIVANLPA